jgi:Fe(3+) dicitrate transport protein
MARAGGAIEATWFLMDYENQVVPASLAGGAGATLTNGGQTRHQGLEISGRVDSAAIASSRHNVFARVAYTWLPVASYAGTRFSSVPGHAVVSVSGHRLPYAPEHLWSGTAGYQHPSGVDAQAECVWTSRQFSDDLNSVMPSADGQRGLVPGYLLWNAAVSYHVPFLRGALFVTVKNVGNVLYIADRSRGVLPGMPRAIHAGIRVNY